MLRTSSLHSRGPVAPLRTKHSRLSSTESAGGRRNRQRLGRASRAVVVEASSEPLTFTATRSDYFDLISSSIEGRSLADYLAQPAVWPSLLGVSDTPGVLDKLLVCTYGTVEILGQKVSPTLYISANYEVNEDANSTGPKKAVLKFSVVDATFGSSAVDNFFPLGNLSSLVFDGTVDVTPVPSSGPVPRVVVSANVAVVAQKDTPELPFGLRESVESAANLAIQSLLDQCVPQAMARLREDYTWWAGLAATTSSAPAFRRAFELGAQPRPQYLAPVAVEHTDTESAYRSAVRAAITGGDAEAAAAEPAGVIGQGAGAIAAAAPAAPHQQGQPDVMLRASPLTAKDDVMERAAPPAAQEDADSAAAERGRYPLRGGQYTPKRRVFPLSPRAKLAPEKLVAAPQQLRTGEYTPPKRQLDGTLGREERAAKAGMAMPQPQQQPQPQRERSALRGGAYTPKKRVLNGTLGREARLARSLGATTSAAPAAAAAAPAAAAPPPKAAAAPPAVPRGPPAAFPAPIPAGEAKSAAAAAAISPDPVAAAVESMAEVSRRASHALFVAALVVRRGMESPEEARKGLIDELLGELRDAEMSLMEARATERAAVQAAEAALEKQREEKRGSVVVASTLLNFALAKSKEAVENAEDMLEKAEDALERMRVPAGGAALPSAAAAARADATNLSAAATAAEAAEKALRKGATVDEAKKIIDESLGLRAGAEHAQQAGEVSTSASAAQSKGGASSASSSEQAAKQAAAEWAAADAAAAERSIHFDEFTSQAGVTKCQGSRSLRFDVLEPLDQQGKPLLSLEEYIADADNLIRIPVRDENLKRFDASTWEICVTQIRIGSFAFVPIYRLEMRYVEGKGLLARSGDIELSPEGLPEVLQGMPIHMRMNTWVTVDRQLLKDREQIPYGEATARMATIKADVSIEVAAAVPQVPGLSQGLRQVGDTVLASILGALQIATDSVLERNYLSRVAVRVREREEQQAAAAAAAEKKQ